jgi:hypothetical protein
VSETIPDESVEAALDAWFGYDVSEEPGSEAVEQFRSDMRAALEVASLAVVAEINEALALTESCSSLKEMAAACVEGAMWKARAEKAESEVARLRVEGK